VEKEELFYPQLRRGEEEVSLEFFALGRRFLFRLEPVPLPLANNSAFLIRR
jgi:hypothetical protein